MADLKCGPCRKCTRRAIVMCSDLPAREAEESERVARGAGTGKRRATTERPPRRSARQSSQNEVSTPTRDDRPRGRPERTTGLPTWGAVGNPAFLRKTQRQDSEIAPVFGWKTLGERPPYREMEAECPEIRHYWCQWEYLEVHDGVLLRRFFRKDGTGEHLQLVVPKVLRREVMAQMHGSLLGGHLGRKKTREKTLQRYYWYGLRSDINLHVASCDECESIKPPVRPARAPLGRMTVGAPLDRLATDILGPLPETPRGNKYVLVVTDHFTKWVEVFAIPDQTAQTIANAILDEVIARFGCPLSLHSDQGANFNGELIAELCKLLEIRKTRTSVYHPSGNGQTERFNRTLMRMVKAYLRGEQEDWDLHLGCLAAAYRSSPHDSTGLTPNLMMLGREVRLPAEILFHPDAQGEAVTSYGEYTDRVRQRLQRAHEVARTHLRVAAARQKQQYDVRVSHEPYDAGALAWLESDLGQQDLAPKMRRPYEGPYLVLRRLGDLNYMVQLDRKGAKRVVHFNRLKPYRGEQTLTWARAALRKFGELSEKEQFVANRQHEDRLDVVE